MNEQNIASRLFLKTAEECGEAVQAIMKTLAHGMEGDWDGKTNKVKMSEELADVSTFISFLLNLDLIDNKAFWAQHDVKHKSWKEKIEKAIKKEESSDNDSK